MASNSAIPVAAANVVSPESRPESSLEPLISPYSVSSEPNLGTMQRETIIEAVRYSGLRCSQLCHCSCHITKTTRSRLFANKVLGHCFYGYTGRPLFRLDCDDENCSQRSAPKFSIMYSFPHWLIKQAIGICFQREAHPQFSISMIRIIAPESEVFRFIRTGDCCQLSKILNSGRASAADIGAFTGMSVLTYAVSHYQVEVCRLLIAHSANPLAPNPSALAPSVLLPLVAESHAYLILDQQATWHGIS